MISNTKILDFPTVEKFEKALYQIYPSILRSLLKDHTTGKNIVWVTSSYQQYGIEFGPDNQLDPKTVIFARDRFLKPRVQKPQLVKSKRTKSNAEVFTPSWVCNLQNNLIDEAWVDVKYSFNVGRVGEWDTSRKPVRFKNNKIWKDYVSDIRLEIACGEAPYLVSRYDAVNGQEIPLEKRIGLLDRKIRIVNENTNSYQSWSCAVIKAFESTYAYELQGDSLFLARENLLFTYIEYFYDRFQKFPSQKQLIRIANIISWNIWQMDGLTYCIPFSKPIQIYEQLELNFEEVEDFKSLDDYEDELIFDSGGRPHCLIADWTKKKNGKPEIIEFCSLINKK